jgi:hypothetical protein
MADEVNPNEPLVTTPPTGEGLVPGVDPSRLDAFKSGFDVEAVSRAGLGDADIISYIREAFPDFDYDAARSVQTVTGDDGEDVKVPGYTDREIISFFTKASPAGPSEALATETARGITVGAPLTAGAVMGTKIGMLGGPFAFITAPLGALFGAGAGYLAGDEIQSWFLPQAPYTPGVRPSGEAGTTLGTGLPMLFAPYAYAGKFIPGTSAYMRNISNLAGRNPMTMDPSKLTPAESIMRRAVEKPGRYLTGEASALGGASWGAALAEKKYPGDALARIGYEVGMGMFSPVSLVVNLAEKSWARGAAFFNEGAAQTRQGQALVDWLKSNAPIEEGLGKEAAEEARASYVRGILEKLKNPDEVQVIASEMGITMPKRTTASLLDDPLVLGLQSNLGRDPQDGPRIKAAIQRDYSGMANLIDLMRGSGDSSLVAEAARIREDFFKGIIVRRLDDANLAALNISKRIDPQDPRAAMKASKTMEELTDAAIKDVRRFEKKLYDAVNENEVVPDGGRSFLAEYTTIEKELAESNIPLPPNVRRLAFKAKGESAEVADQNAATATRIQGQIGRSQDAIEKINASSPDSVSAVSQFFKASDSPELQLSDIQNGIRALQAGDALSKFSIKAPERNRRLTVLENQAQIISARLRLDDLAAQRPTSDVPEEITIGELMRARSTLLNDARSAAARKDFNSAHYLSDLADAIKDDLGVAAGGADASLSNLTPNQAALREAFDFSRSLNDVFSRAFPDTVLAKTRAGSRKVMPEIMHKSLFSGGGDATSLKYDQLENAMIFASETLAREGAEAPRSSVGTMREAQAQLLRNIVSNPKIVGPDGKINAEGLAKHLREYRNVYFDEQGLSRFPELTADLQDAQKAQSMIETALAGKGRYEDAVKNSEVFGQLPLAGTNPQKLIGNILGTPDSRGAADPAGAFRKLIRYAKSADSRLASEGKPTGAVKGIFDIVFERGNLYASNVDQNGNQIFNMKAFSDYLRKPMNPKGDSPLEIMRQEGVLSSPESVRLNTILSEGIKSQGQRALAGESESIPGNIATRGIDTLFRLVGLRVGRKATQMAPGQGQGLAEPMMIANEFSALLNVPKMKHRDLLLRAVEDPDFFKLLLEKGGEGGSRSARRRNRLNAYLYDAGFVGATDYEREKQRREFDPRELRNMPRQTVRPPVAIPQQRSSLAPVAPVPTRAAPAPAPSPVPPPPAAPGPTPSGPVDRARFLQAFPTGPAADLAREQAAQQGIGSLMGP